MKNLTKAITLLLTSLFFYQTNAQTFAIKGGLSASNINIKYNGTDYSDYYNMKPGFHLGVTADFTLNTSLSVEHGYILTTKGSRLINNTAVYSYNSTIDFYYLDIPLNLKISHSLNEKLKVFGTIGPYLSIGLSGKTKFKEQYFGETELEESSGEHTIEWGFNKEWDDLKRPEIGGSIGAGFEINSILFGVSYDLGLSNSLPGNDNYKTQKNRVLKVSVGYRL